MRPRHTNEEVKARLIFIVGVGLTIAFIGLIFTVLYGVLFVSQPLEQAPSDKDMLVIINALALFLTGALSGLLAGNGLKDKPKDPPV
jgi:hypothetical protein